MVMKKLWPLLALLIFPGICFAQVIAVSDFTTTEPAIVPHMAGVTGVFRTALSQNNMAILSTDTNTADYLISGNITRLGYYAKEEVPEDEPAWLLPLLAGGLTRSAFPMFLSVFGSGMLSNNKKVDKEQETPEHQAIINAEMIDRKTKRIIASGSITCHNVEEYIRHVPSFAKQFLDKLPASDIWSGVWTGKLESGNVKDEYTLTFGDKNRCTITVNSTNETGKPITQTATGRYRYNDQILAVNVDFGRNPAVPYVHTIEWNVIPSMSNDRASFSVVVPASSAPGVERVRVIFWKE